MDPYFEQRLRDEVIYLHSLWRQGPPNRNRNRNPSPNPSIHLHLSNPTQFKKEKSKPKPKGKRSGKKLPSISDLEWPCPDPAEPPPSSATGWPVLKLPTAPSTRLPSAEEQARFAATKSQQNALKAAQDYFADSDSDSDEDDFMDEDDGEEYRFFLKLFAEDGELRGYYERNWKTGDFSCLVCGGIGKKVGKKFFCVALVQHSNGIVKTKKKRAHRALARVICKVLGWDINRLPTNVLSLGDPLGSSLGKSIKQGNVEVDMDDSDTINQNLGSENVKMVRNEVSNVGQEGEVHIPGISDVVGDDVMLSESSSKVCDANESMENSDSGNLSRVERKTEGVVDGLEPCEDSGVGNEIKNDRNETVVANDLEDNNEIQK